MEILQYLAKLVENRKEVGIPGLGTFYKKKSPGKYDTASHAFIPPVSKLQFKTEVTEHTVLADYIRKERNISTNSALFFIGQFAEEIQNQLKLQHEASLEPIGKLISTDGHIAFEPKANLNPGLDFYGLPPVKEEEITAAGAEEPSSAIEEPVEQESLTAYPAEEEVNARQPDSQEPAEQETTEEETSEQEKIDQEEVEQEKIEQEEIATNELITDEPIVQESIEEPALNAAVGTTLDKEEENPTLATVVAENTATEENPGDPVVPAIEENTVQEPLPEEEYQVKKTPVYLKVILGILIALIVFFVVYLIYPDAINNFYENHIQKAEQQTTIAPVKPVKVNKAPDTVIPSQDTTKNLAAVQPPDTSAITYEVIGSSPYRLKEAEQFISNMKAKYGINAKIVSQKKGKKIKISIATFKTKKEADLERQRLSKKIGIKGLYTYPNTHKQEIL